MQVELFRVAADSNQPRFQCFRQTFFFYHLYIDESSFNAVKTDWCYQTLITAVVIASTFEKVILNSGQSNWLSLLISGVFLIFEKPGFQSLSV